jgi:hypothetical protein
MLRTARLGVWCAALLVGSLLWVRPAAARPWTRRYVDSLPDSAFAVVEVRPDGKKARHLPHHDRSGRVDLPHLRNALSRVSQVKWVDPAHAATAEQHLRQHLRELQRQPAEQP